ncbi:MAG: hypothetical protein K6U12_05955 [Armatimonadetes bacterium]|nr:hypothetical protein [Armatimonadota bacterium]
MRRPTTIVRCHHLAPLPAHAMADLPTKANPDLPPRPFYNGVFEAL